MTILVTGGTGLVGSRLLRRLVESGIECRALVRAGKALPSGVIPVIGDLLDPASLASAVEGVSAIVHLAAVFRTADTDEIWKANLEGSRQLIVAARQYAPEARFIMASTGLVYDAHGQRPGREDDAADPQLAYPASKLAAENLLRDSGLNWSILRLSFVYGDDDGHLQSVPKLVGAYKWHPASRLSMIHHRDVATIVKLALQGAMDRRIVNVVDESPMSLYEIAALVGETMQPSSEPLANPWWGQIDGSLARSLGFHPAVATAYQAARENAL